MRGSGRMFFKNDNRDKRNSLCSFCLLAEAVSSCLYRLVFIVLSLSSSSYFSFTTFVAEALRPSIAVPAVPSLMKNLALS